MTNVYNEFALGLIVCFQTFISSPKDEIKLYAAELYSIVIVTTKKSEEILDAVKDLLNSLKDKVSK